MILLLANNERHLNLFRLIKENSPDKVIVATSFPPSSSVNVDIKLHSVLTALISKNLVESRMPIQDGFIARAFEFDRNLSIYPQLFKKPCEPFDYNEVYSEFYSHCKRLLADNNIKEIYSELIIGFIDAVLHRASLADNVVFYGIRQAKLLEGIVLVDPLTEEPIRKNFEKTHLKEDVDNVLRDMKQKYIRPNYMRHSKKTLRVLNKRTMFSLFRFIVKFYKLDYINHRMNDIRFLIFKSLNKMKLYRNKNKFFADKSTLPYKYFVFPLQFEPEATVLVRGYPYTDQIALCELMARSLPDDYILVVKEHRGNIGYRKISDYIRLNTVPKIMLVSPEFPVKKLLTQSQGVITISGMMGLEAMAIKKPVFCFGSPFWKGVAKHSASPNLSEAFRELNRFINSPEIVEDEELIKLISTYQEAIFDGTFLSLDEKFLSTFNVEQFNKILGLST